MEIIKIKYFTELDNDFRPLEKITKGDWIDLRSAQEISLRPYDRVMIPLGVAMKLPEGYEAHVLPRSSTFKVYGIIMTNSTGIIDNSYCGDGDQWHFPALATRYTHIHRGDRIAQFRIVKNQPEIIFEEVAWLGDDCRGGFGSTGVK